MSGIYYRDGLEVDASATRSVITLGGASITLEPHEAAEVASVLDTDDLDAEDRALQAIIDRGNKVRLEVARELLEDTGYSVTRDLTEYELDDALVDQLRDASEKTLVATARRLLEHTGCYVFDPDVEERGE